MLELEKLLRWCRDAFSFPGKQTEVQGSKLNCPRSETGSEPELVLSGMYPGSFILLLMTTRGLSWTLKALILICEHPKEFLLTITLTQWASLSIHVLGNGVFDHSLVVPQAGCVCSSGTESIQCSLNTSAGQIKWEESIISLLSLRFHVLI